MTSPNQTIPQIIRAIQAQHPGLDAQLWREGASQSLARRSFPQFYQLCLDLAGFLTSHGVQRGDPIGLLGENRPEWSIADIGIQACGACDVPRGRDITDQEIRIIFGTTASKIVVVERAIELQRLLEAKPDLPALTTLVLMEGQIPSASQDGVAMISFDDALGQGAAWRATHPEQVEIALEAGSADEMATIIFTSGTTGKPKGVMLTQSNYINHVQGGRERLATEPGDVWMTMLPVWHSFERSVQYIALGNGVALAYSKPVASIMMKDFAEINPHYTTAVPRIWEAVYNAVQKKIDSASGLKRGLAHFFIGLGGRYVSLDNLWKGLSPAWQKRNRALDAIFACLPRLLLMPLNALGKRLVLKTVKALFGTRLKGGISGGGSLQKKIDLFFASAGIVLLEGYGLTEAGPVVAVRKIHAPEARTVGTAFLNMELKVVDEQGRTLPPNSKGLIMTRGRQVMRGYYRDPEGTARVLSPDGWLNTGDLGMLTHDGALAIVGRLKDTIVLLGGENIEPVPIEIQLCYSPLIETAVVVGQDQKQLGVLIVPAFEKLKEHLAAINLVLDMDKPETLIAAQEIKQLYRQEIDGIVNRARGFKSFETIGNFTLLHKPFEVHKELSAKQELKRAHVAQLYDKEIAGLFK